MSVRGASVEERYDVATETSDLSLMPGRCDADVLLAAGYAASRNTRGAQALALYRMRATGSRAGMARAIDWAAGWLLDRRLPWPNRKPVRVNEAREIATAVLQWWLDDVCRQCQGRRYELVPGTQVVSDNICHACAGTGRSPVQDRVRREHQDCAQWLAGECERAMAFVLSDMARRLSQRIVEDAPKSCEGGLQPGVYG